MRKVLLMMLAAAMLVASLAACNNGTASTETGTGEGTGTTAETEAATAIPRYDYMAADVAGNVTIAREDYMGLTLTIPNSLKVTDEDVQKYIRSSILFSKYANNLGLRTFILIPLAKLILSYLPSPSYFLHVSIQHDICGRLAPPVTLYPLILRSFLL